MKELHYRYITEENWLRIVWVTKEKKLHNITIGISFQHDISKKMYSILRKNSRKEALLHINSEHKSIQNVCKVILGFTIGNPFPFLYNGSPALQKKHQMMEKQKRLGRFLCKEGKRQLDEVYRSYKEVTR